MVAAIGRDGGAGLSSRRVLVLVVGAEGRDVLAVTPDAPPLPLPLVLIAENSELRFNLPMMVRILADLRVLGGSIPLGPGVGVLPVPFQPSYEATDDGQAGVPTQVLGAGYGTWPWLLVWLWMRKLQRLFYVRVILLLMRMLHGLVDV